MKQIPYQRHSFKYPMQQKCDSHFRCLKAGVLKAEAASGTKKAKQGPFLPMSSSKFSHIDVTSNEVATRWLPLPLSVTRQLLFAQCLCKCDSHVTFNYSPYDSDVTSLWLSHARHVISPQFPHTIHAITEQFLCGRHVVATGYLCDSYVIAVWFLH